MHTPYDSTLKSRARFLRKTLTPAERKLWFEYLSKSRFKFTKQKPIGNYIADFYCASKKLVIEIDGDSHFTKQAVLYDEERTKRFNEMGIRVIRFTNVEVLQGFEWVCGEIEKELRK